ncbi:hypothetical protein [Streptomyces albipurpureus]|uniref:Uncharacterized protein n=1 Tax=Streptomyces albipurpureus TaxID=2897419 RepID=A0ABT0UER2_9ACTN|nr:hypothetical protein [Streptomyces sp. CWNU-1]MCM2387058.1 hypothetical protein [Streptomyces sp. CWNU-1]
MAQSPTFGVLARLAEVGAAPADRGELWRLDAVARQLDANIVRLAAGERVRGQSEPDLDVLLCVLSGSGEVETAGQREPLEPGSVAWLPQGTERALLAGDGGLVYVTAHRRRPGLTPGGAGAGAAEGGEPACLLSRICPSCDRPSDDLGARYCGRCGTELPY